MSSAKRPIEPLSGGTLVLGALAIGMANFMMVLDTTIANVAVPTISATKAPLRPMMRHASSAVPKTAGFGKYSPKTIALNSLPGPPRSKPWRRSNSRMASPKRA